ARGRVVDAAAEAAKLQASPEAFVLQAEIAKRSGDLAAALRLLEGAEQLARKDGRGPVFRLDFVRGDALARMERSNEAIAAYEREIAAFPNDLDAYAGLAILHFVTGDRAASERALQRLTDANPTDRARALAAKTRATLRE
ncbi:MAG: tetratricopeptide repeat protein, partial [Thermoanaerobaculia bacterium]